MASSAIPTDDIYSSHLTPSRVSNRIDTVGARRVDEIKQMLRHRRRFGDNLYREPSRRTQKSCRAPATVRRCALLSNG
jgi:hypothetical protein